MVREGLSASRHSREGGNPVKPCGASGWIPAFAGMTLWNATAAGMTFWNAAAAGVTFWIPAVALLMLSACAAPERPPADTASPSVADAPAAPREFRAAWVASVANIDWPSRPGLPVTKQHEEIRRIVERAADLRLNALIVQVRPAADALYASALEPWSEYLTGEQGRAPEPFYDPLLAWIEEAHARGIELHAWFNPYRARHPTAKSALAPTHVANAAPHLVKSYGTQLWMDPGEPESAQRTLAVILDVVRRYDIDGVHIDDYFYPYPANAPAPPGETGAEIEFPDEASWGAYLRSGGSLGRADWRRQNVNALVERILDAVHREKSWMKFGISPFGLGRPDRRPPGIAGFSQYDKLYADVELWVAKGWFDYLAPQLYWPIDQAPQAFGVLLDYWARDNPFRRHVWPGLFTSRIDGTPASWPASEIVNQVGLARAQEGIGGHIHFSMVSLLDNRKGIADRLKSTEYAQAALVPATPWLGAAAPAPPQVSARRLARDSGALLVEVTDSPGEAPWLYAVWVRHGTDWRFHVHPAGRAGLRLEADSRNRPPEAIVVSAVSRLGAESDRVTAHIRDYDAR
jgi:uncharacterized lipoprotein YddW (UPF0748 family)